MTHLKHVETGTNATQIHVVGMHKMGGIWQGRKMWGVLLQECIKDFTTIF